MCYNDGMWYVYILETNNGMFYTGSTTDVHRRVDQHAKGKGARFTRIFGVKKLLYTEEQPNQSEAFKREQDIKTWPKHKKLALIGKPDILPS